METAKKATLFVHLATCNVITLYISSLSWLEFMHVVGSAAWRAQLPAAWQDQYQLHRWQDVSVRQTYLRAMRSWLEHLLMAYSWAEIDLTSTISQQALQYVELYNLDTHDAAHWASAQAAGVLDLASFDKGFLRVDSLHLWTL